MRSGELSEKREVIFIGRRTLLPRLGLLTTKCCERINPARGGTAPLRCASATTCFPQQFSAARVLLFGGWNGRAVRADPDLKAPSFKILIVNRI